MSFNKDLSKTSVYVFFIMSFCSIKKVISYTTLNGLQKLKTTYQLYKLQFIKGFNIFFKFLHNYLEYIYNPNSLVLTEDLKKLNTISF